VETHGLAHPANLAVATLSEYERQHRSPVTARFGEEADIRWNCPVAVEKEGLSQPGKDSGVHYAGDHDLVRLRVAVAGMGQSLDQVPVVGKQEQPFAVLVEPTDGDESLGRQAMNQVQDRASLGGRRAADIASRLVEEDRGGGFGSEVNGLPAIGNPVPGWVNAAAWIEYRGVVDPHAAV
jgi:hypothetical protein